MRPCGPAPRRAGADEFRTPARSTTSTDPVTTHQEEQP
jgi:hypothetical protein